MLTVTAFIIRPLGGESNAHHPSMQRDGHRATAAGSALPALCSSCCQHCWPWNSWHIKCLALLPLPLPRPRPRPARTRRHLPLRGAAYAKKATASSPPLALRRVIPLRSRTSAILRLWSMNSLPRSHRVRHTNNKPSKEEDCESAPPKLILLVQPMLPQKSRTITHMHPPMKNIYLP